MSAVKCCTQEILCTHRLYKIRGNIARKWWACLREGFPDSNPFKWIHSCYKRLKMHKNMPKINGLPHSNPKPPKFFRAIRPVGSISTKGAHTITGEASCMILHTWWADTNGWWGAHWIGGDLSSPLPPRWLRACGLCPYFKQIQGHLHLYSVVTTQSTKAQHSLIESNDFINEQIITFTIIST